MDLVDRLCPEDWYTQQRAAFRKAIAEKSNMYELILRVYQLDPEVRKTFFKNFYHQCKSERQPASGKNTLQNITVIFPGPSFWIPHPPATSTVPDAGQPSTDISSIWILIPLIPSSAREKKWAPICIFIPEASPRYAKKI